MIAYTYLEDRNPDGAYLPGVPLRNLEQAEVDALPKWLQLSIEASPFYQKARSERQAPAPKADKASDSQ